MLCAYNLIILTLCTTWKCSFVIKKILRTQYARSHPGGGMTWKSCITKDVRKIFPDFVSKQEDCANQKNLNKEINHDNIKAKCPKLDVSAEKPAIDCSIVNNVLSTLVDPRQDV